MNAKATGHFQVTVKPSAAQRHYHTRTHLVSGDRDPSEDAPWYTL